MLVFSGWSLRAWSAQYDLDWLISVFDIQPIAVFVVHVDRQYDGACRNFRRVVEAVKCVAGSCQ